MSFKYSVLKKVFGLINTQKMMSQPYDKLIRLFKSRDAKPDIPKLSDSELDFKVFRVNDFPVLYIRHKKPTDSVCVYLVGGGMLKYPKPLQVKKLIKLAKTIGRDIILPYYPLCPNYTLPNVYDMLYKLYRKLLKKYSADNIAFLGVSSGGNLALGLVSHINAAEEGLPMPGKIYASSPGTLHCTAEEKKRAACLNEKDLVMSTTALENIWDGMTGGKDVPDYMKYLQKGNYSCLKDVYLSFGSDEIFAAAADSIKSRLEEFGVHVTLEIGEGMYHTYAAMPLVFEAQQGYDNLTAYLKKQ